MPELQKVVDDTCVDLLLPKNLNMNNNDEVQADNSVSILHLMEEIDRNSDLSQYQMHTIYGA